MTAGLPFEAGSLLVGLLGSLSTVLVYRFGSRIRKSKKHLQGVFDHVDPMVVVDRGLRVLRANRPFSVLAGRPFPDLVGKCLPDIATDLSLVFPALRACMEEGREIGAFEIPVRDSVLEAQIFPLGPSLGPAPEAILRLRDATALASARKELVDRNESLRRLTDALHGELEMAREIHQALLPGDIPRLEGLSFKVRYLPSRPVGGDLYDLCLLDDTHLGVFVADVAGHGLPAAFEAALVRMSFLNHATAEASTAQVFERMNRDLRRSLVLGHYVTAFLGILDLKTLELRFCRASHPRPVLFGADGTRRTLGAKGLFLGIVDEGGYREESLQLQHGDRLCVFTDGCYEAANKSGKRLGYEGFLARIPASTTEDPIAALASLEEEFPGQTEDGREDDRTFIAIDLVSAVDNQPPVLRRLASSGDCEIRIFRTAQEGWDLIEDLCKGLMASGWSARDARKAQLVASELCVNAVVHGLHDRPQGKASCAWTITKDQCLFSVHDEGHGFDPSNLPDPRETDRLGLDHGRGVFLVRKIAEELWYDDGGTTATFRLLPKFTEDP